MLGPARSQGITTVSQLGIASEIRDFCRLVSSGVRL